MIDDHRLEKVHAAIPLGTETAQPAPREAALKVELEARLQAVHPAGLQVMVDF